MYKTLSHALAALMVLASASLAGAQTKANQPQAKPLEQRWSVDFAIGFDNSISGNIN